MLLARPMLADDRGVPRRDVADVRREAVPRVERVEPAHDAVAGHLRHDRGGRDRRALRVAVHHRLMLGRGRPEPEAVDEARLRGRCEIREHGRAAPRGSSGAAPSRSISPAGMIRTLIRVAQPTTARKSSSRSGGATCFESFRKASGRTRWSRRHS